MAFPDAAQKCVPIIVSIVPLLGNNDFGHADLFPPAGKVLQTDRLGQVRFQVLTAV
jgi:hypothetical protein